MHGTLQQAYSEQRQIERQLRQGTDKIVSPSDFTLVAKVLWPVKTAACLAAIAGKDERTAARWLSGEFEPPNIIIAAIMCRLISRN